jgi:hypothetical protein
MQSIAKKKSGTYYRNVRLFKSMYNSHFGGTVAAAPTANESPESTIVDDMISEEVLGAFCFVCIWCILKNTYLNLSCIDYTEPDDLPQIITSYVGEPVDTDDDEESTVGMSELQPSQEAIYSTSGN